MSTPSNITHSQYPASPGLRRELSEYFLDETQPCPEICVECSRNALNFPSLSDTFDVAAAELVEDCINPDHS
jgi:hypothetical protein